MLDAREDESGSEKGDQHRAGGVEGLGEIQPSFRAFRRTQRGDIRIGGDLQNRLSTRHHEKGEEEESVDPNGGGRNKQDCPSRADEQADQDSSLVAEPLHQPSGGQSSEKITAKKCRLNE